MHENRAQDLVVAFDGRQSPAAAALQRRGRRALRALGHSVVTELSLANGRRADVVALSGAGDIAIVEIKSCLLDFQTDGKWQDYLPFCDRLYFAVPPEMPQEILPADCGLIVADNWGADILRDSPLSPLVAARRKAVTLRFARAAALRLHGLHDPEGVVVAVGE